MKQVIVLVVLMTSTAHAAPETPRDPDTALTLSIVGTAVPVVAITLGLSGVIDSIHPYKSQDVDGVLIVGGALVGLITPSLGEHYCRQWFTRGMAMRAGGLALAVGGSVGLILWSEDGDGVGSIPKGSLAVVIAGAALYLGGAVSDIVAAPSTARHANERFALTPTLLHTEAGTMPGLSMAGQF